MTIRARTIVAVALASATCALAQFPPGGGGGGGGGGGDGGGPPGGGRGGDMQRGPGGMMGMGDGVEQAKAPLKATDEEWQVLRPAIQKVVNARRVADTGLVGGQPRGGMFGGRGGRGGPGGGMGNDSFNGPNNSGPGGRGGNRGGGGGGGGPPGEGNPDGPPPPANSGGQANGGGQGNQGGGQGGGQPQGQNGGNRQQNNGGNGGPNAGGPPGMAAPTGPIGTAMTDLKTMAGKDGAKVADLNAKIAAVRAERKKARDALGTAVDELKALVTPEQEAMLIALGFIE